MSVYDYNISQATIDLTPPNKRQPTTLAYLGVPGYLLQKYHTLFFNQYANGNNASDWEANSYSYESQVRYIDNKIYEVTNPDGVSSVLPPPQDPDNWKVVQNNFIGVREREKYTAQKIVFEYALNKWFKTTFQQPPATSEIYIVRNDIDNNSFLIGVDEDESSSIALSDDLQESFVGDEYITNTYLFTIFIPLAVYDALKADDPSGITATKDGIVRAFADKYKLAGINYNIQTY